MVMISKRCKDFVYGAKNMLKNIGQDIWIVKLPLLPFGTMATMTIVRIGKKLIILSPVKPYEGLFDEIDRLGEVAVIIAPNGYHHLYFKYFTDQYPDAEFLYSKAAHKKILKRIENHAHAQELNELGNYWWMKDVQMILIDGMPAVQEHVFYHGASKTLVVFDAWFNINQSTSRMARFFWFLVGLKPHIPGQSRYFRSRIKDCQAYKKSMTKIKDLLVDRIVVAHENIIEGQKICRDLIHRS